VQDRHRTSAAKGGQLPGATGGAHAHGLAIAVAVVMGLAVPRFRLRLSVPVASRRARSLAWWFGRGSGDTMNVFTANNMNVFTANDLEGADLLAPVRQRDGAPLTPYWPATARLSRDMAGRRRAGTASRAGDDRSSARPQPHLRQDSCRPRSLEEGPAGDAVGDASRPPGAEVARGRLRTAGLPRHLHCGWGQFRGLAAMQPRSGRPGRRWRATDGPRPRCHRRPCWRSWACGWRSTGR